MTRKRSLTGRAWRDDNNKGRNRNRETTTCCKSFRPSAREQDNVTVLRPERLEERKQIRQTRRQLWRYLCRDRDFVLETARLRYNLTLHYRKDPKILETLFDGGYLVTPSEFKKELKQISSVSDTNLRTILERYLQYAIRFQVYMLLLRSHRGLHRACPFSVCMISSQHSTFQARVEHGR